MSWGAFSFLVEQYWIYLAIAFAAGVVAGWVSVGSNEG